MTEKVYLNYAADDYCYTSKDGAGKDYWGCIQKLGRLEDLEEQGRLIEVKHGRWIYKDNFIGKYLMCSECSHVTGRKSNYCPNCGAKLKELEGDKE